MTDCYELDNNEVIMFFELPYGRSMGGLGWLCQLTKGSYCIVCILADYIIMHYNYNVIVCIELVAHQKSMFKPK